MTQNNDATEKERALLGEHISRRRFLKAAGVAAAGLAISPLLEACAPAAAPAPTPAKVTPVAELAGVVAPMAARGELPEQTIILAMFSGPEADAHKRLAPKWLEYTKGKVKLEVEDLGRGTAAETKWLTTMMAKAEAWDVIWETDRRMKSSGAAGFHVPLEPLMADANLFNAKAYDLEDFPKSVRDMYTYKGKLLGLSQEVSTVLMMYRKDLLDKYGIKHPPATGWSWEETRENSLILKDKLKADGQPADVFPLVFGVKGPSSAAYQSWWPLWANGVDWFDEKTQTPKLYQPGSVEALTFMTNLVWKDGVVTPGLTDYESYMEVLTAYQQGKAVMAIQWVAASPTFNDKEKSPLTAGKTGYTLYPHFKKKDPKFPHPYFHGHGVAVSAFSKKQKAAFEYLIWWTSKEIARDYVVKGGGTSGRASVLGDPEIQKAAGPHLQAHLDSLKAGRAPYDTPEIAWIVSTGLGPNMSAIWAKMKPIEQALKDADADIIKYYKEKGILK